MQMLWMCLLVVAQEPREVSGEAAMLERPPTTQQAALEPSRVLEGDELVLGETRYRMRLTKTAVELTLDEKGAKRQRAKSGATLDLGPAQVVVERRLDGRWILGAAGARRFSIAGRSLWIVDADLDGRFDGFGRDGWATSAEQPLQVLGPELRLADAIVAIDALEPDGSRMTARLGEVEVSPGGRNVLLEVNRLRLGQGLRAVTFDPSIAAGCSAHARYLRQRGWNGRTNPHAQDPADPGYTPEGHAAAVRSNIMRADHATAVDVFWRSYYHRIGLIRPDLGRIGFSDPDLELSVIDVASGVDGKFAPAEWRPVILVPADGSADFPTNFPRGGEKPQDPIPNAAKAGSPLMVLLLDASRPVDAYQAELFELKGKKRVAVPTAVAEPDRWGTFVRGVLPKKPLKARTEYEVVHTLRLGGAEETHRARFRTR